MRDAVAPHTIDAGASGAVTLRHPTVADGSAIHELVRRAGTLEQNTEYCYLLFCRHFADTCVVVEGQGGALLGFVQGYRPPEQPDTLFVWQVGVAPEGRRRGLGLRMLRWLFDRGEGLRFLEASVAPSNAASAALFSAFAREVGAPLEESPFLDADLFSQSHEPEALFRIGPAKGPHTDGGAAQVKESP